MILSHKKNLFIACAVLSALINNGAATLLHMRRRRLFLKLHVECANLIKNPEKASLIL